METSTGHIFHKNQLYDHINTNGPPYVGIPRIRSNMIEGGKDIAMMLQIAFRVEKGIQVAL
jgi:hypothetical protein